MDKVDIGGGIYIYRFEGDYFDANSYIIIEGNEALIIDAVDSSDMVSFLLGEYEGGDTNAMFSELWMPDRETAGGGNPGLTILLTHEHFDHIGGLETLRSRFRCHVIASKECSRRIQSSQANLSSIGDTLLAMHNGTGPKKLIPRYEAAAADAEFPDECSIMWNGHRILCHPMRGHSPGSAGYILDGKILFSGDEILPIPTVTRLPGGDTRAFWYEDMPWLESLGTQLSLVCPGHGTPGKLEDMISVNAMPKRFRNMGEKANA